MFLRCETNSRLFRLTPIKINKTAARAAGALLNGGQPLCEQRRHSRVALLPRLYFRRQGAVDFLGGAAARGRRRAAALSVARARARRRRARRVASTGGRRRAHAARSGPMGASITAPLSCRRCHLALLRRCATAAHHRHRRAPRRRRRHAAASVTVPRRRRAFVARARRCALGKGVGGTSRCVSREDFNRDPDFDSRRDRRRRLSRLVFRVSCRAHVRYGTRVGVLARGRRRKAPLKHAGTARKLSAGTSARCADAPPLRVPSLL